VHSALEWERPSPRVAELIRSGASLVLEAPEEIFAEVDAAVLADADHPLASDPVLAEAIRRQNHANLVRWAEANFRDPGAPVPAEPGTEAIAIARDLVRRGLDVDALQGYRIGQNIGWQRWMALAFELTSDPDELRELLDVTARSIFTYVDEMLLRLATEVDRERERLTRDTHVQRLEVVSLILEGAPIAATRASARLGYELDRPHTAAVVWSDRPETDPGDLEQAAEAVGRAAGARPLTVVASVATLWVWVAGETAPDLDVLGGDLGTLLDVRVAVGPTARGMQGFRRSHLDALATQRLMHRSGALRVASYEDVQVVALATADEERAQEFVARTLGDFASAPAELRDTVRVYLREGSNASRAARVLFAHRNTVLSRLARAEALLPAPLDGRGLAVGLALEIVHWRGPQG
jgi:DNA-binding PucR family transcriptional regulator